MSITEESNLEEEELQRTNAGVKGTVVPLRAVAGGGSGEYYWLLDLEAGAHFLCRVRVSKMDKEHSELKEFWLVGLGERARLLELVMADGSSIRTWVDPIQFSKDMFLYETLEK